MKISERIAELRVLMKEKNIDAYVVPTADFHQSEYVGEHFKARKFIIKSLYKIHFLSNVNIFANNYKIFQKRTNYKRGIILTKDKK